MNVIVFFWYLFAVVYLQLFYFPAQDINLSDESMHSSPLK